MAQLAIYLDDETARQLDKAAKKAGVSRSACVREALRVHLKNSLPRTFFDVLGTWEDDRNADEILDDIRTNNDDKAHPSLD